MVSPELMRRRFAALFVCLLCGMAQLGTPAQGAPETTRTAEVSGTVSGYFLTPDERLTQRTLQLASGVAAGVTESLRPLRCRYHLTATLTAPVEIAGVRMETPDGATVWRQEVTPPARTVSIPREGGTSLLVRPVDGLDYEVHYRDTEGTWASVSCRPPGIKFLASPEPAINWADLGRTAHFRLGPARRRGNCRQTEGLVPPDGLDCRYSTSANHSFTVSSAGTPRPSRTVSASCQ
jgi:hypothetical protein